MSQWTESVTMHRAERALLNDSALSGARNKTMVELLGDPRDSYSQDCQSPTSQKLTNLIVTADLGPFKATGLAPAVDTLKTIFAQVKTAEPDIYGRLTTAGMLCCRFVRDSTSAISNHSWGCAIDLKIDGVLDGRGDDRIQKGLLQIYRHFNAHGFYWGAGFPTEDAMHFEASDQLMHQWAADGKLGADVHALPPEEDTVEFRDRSTAVADIQAKLALLLGIDIEADGIFGPKTRAAVIQFQHMYGLEADGVVGSTTRARLLA